MCGNEQYQDKALCCLTGHMHLADHTDHYLMHIDSVHTQLQLQLAGLLHIGCIQLQKG